MLKKHKGKGNETNRNYYEVIGLIRYLDISKSNLKFT